MYRKSPMPGLIWVTILALASVNVLAEETPTPDESATPDDDKTDTRPSIAPDIRDDDTKLKVQKGDFVVVPIPMSNPTLDTGLIVGGAYFYAQSEEQAKKQPASLTGAAGMYTSNDSKAFGIAQQNYWKNNRWRFTGMLAAADIRLRLLAPDDSSNGQYVDYKVGGPLLFGQISRRIAGKWYIGLQMRVISARQSLQSGTDTEGSEKDFNFEDVVASGLGLTVEYDSRDLPMNTYHGSHAKIKSMFNQQSIGSGETYQSYSAFYRLYGSAAKNLVLAWDIQGCGRVGRIPLWDACTIALRGFPVTDYLGMASGSTQIEARWKFSKHWGLVGFAGAGFVGDSFAEVRDNEAIPSYGVGVRFMVLQSKRINMRLDFARSVDSDAVYLSVGEAF